MANPTIVLLQTVIELFSTDLVAELRAEVTRWWESIQKQQQASRNANGPTASTSSTSPSQSPGTSCNQGGRGSMLTPILGAMLGDGPIRMITLGQELTVDVDDKLLMEMQFKDNQVR